MRASAGVVAAQPGLCGCKSRHRLHPVDANGEHVPGEAASCFASFWTAEWSHVELDLGRGFRATGRKAELELTGILDRRHFSQPDFQLGPNAAALSNVYLPCSSGRLAEFGVEWPGAPSVYPGPRGPSSSAYMAVAESWVM